MERRTFLKISATAPIIPSILVTDTKTERAIMRFGDLYLYSDSGELYGANRYMFKSSNIILNSLAYNEPKEYAIKGGYEIFEDAFVSPKGWLHFMVKCFSSCELAHPEHRTMILPENSAWLIFRKKKWLFQGEAK